MADESESTADSPSEKYSTEDDALELPTSTSPIGENVITRFMARFGTMAAPSLIDRVTPEQLDKLIEQADAAGKPKITTR